VVTQPMEMEMDARPRRRVAQALLEAVLIVFAVLVALGVDEYWETREEQQLAATAVERVDAELRGNRAELLVGRESNRALLDSLGKAVIRLSSGEPLGISGVNYEVALVGADAWETAQVTRAVHFMDFDVTTRISRVYRVQRLFADLQGQVVDDVAGIGGNDQTLEGSFRSIRGGIATTLGLECQLLATYDSVLGELSDVEVSPPLGQAAPDCL
jgi:hypothetical protein